MTTFFAVVAAFAVVELWRRFHPTIHPTIDPVADMVDKLNDRGWIVTIHPVDATGRATVDVCRVNKPSDVKLFTAASYRVALAQALNYAR